MTHRAQVMFLAIALAAIAARASAADTDADLPGVILVIEPGAKATFNAGFLDARVSRMVSLYVPRATPPSDFTPPGPFRATFRGDLNLRLRSYIRFSAEGRGKLTLALNGANVLETSGDDLSTMTSNEVRLNKGKNQLVATYESPAAGDASLRLFWSSKSFLPEPLPPNLLSHAAPEPAIARSLVARDGRFLITQFRCTRCHALTAPAGNDLMAELATDAPSLADAGARFNSDWLVAWINDPHALRPTAHMPRLFSGDHVDQRARDIAAYLATFGKPSSEAINGDAANGGRLYANLDCVACHTPPDSSDDPTRVPHKYLAAKFRPAALKAFLLDPTAHYAWNPMPNFHLSEPEADDLTAFLLASGQKLRKEPGGDAVKGKSLLSAIGCLNCHSAGQELTALKAPPFDALVADKLDKGCLAADSSARGNSPIFAMETNQRDAIKTFLVEGRQSLFRNCASEFAERQISAMRCTACHSRDGNESLIAQSLDSESQALHQKYPNPPPVPGELLAAEQKPPLLTWVGGKLRPEWMERFIGGEISYKPRYFLRARMPAFAARAKWLAAGLAMEEGCPPTLAPNPAPDVALAEEGRKLAGKVPNVGFSCVQCHSVADVPPFAAFEAPSINLKYVADRMRHDYYLRWMHDPLRIDPASKMPRFDDAEGKTGLPAFDSDAKKQFEAIWQYLLEGAKIRPPQ